MGDPLTTDELSQWRKWTAECGCAEDGICEAWGCITVKPLLDEVDRLRANVTRLLKGNMTKEEWHGIHEAMKASGHSIKLGVGK